MRKAFKYRLYPNRAQTEALEERRDAYDYEQRTISYGEQSSKLKEARKVDPYLAKTNFSSTQATLRRLDRSFKAFFRQVRNGERAGYPRFKGKDRFKLVEFPSYGDGCRLKEGGRLYVQYIGHIKVKLHRPVEGKIRTVSVKKSCDRWYVIFCCNALKASEAKGDSKAVGIDLGLKSFLATSDGEAVKPPRYYRRAQKKLRHAQRSLARKKKGSNHRRKAREHVARKHEKIANQRRDFHHKLARKLVSRYGFIAHEALGVRGIARTCLAKSAHDAGWAQFLSILAQKAEEAAVRVVAVNPRMTTQACSRCGDLPEVKKTLSVRVHRCQSCGYTCDRDVTAAQNILGLGRSPQDATWRVGACVS